MDELIEGQAGVPAESAQCAFGQWIVQGDGQAAVGRIRVPEDDMAADPAKRFDCPLTGDRRQLHPAGTSTTSSSMPRGMGSPCSRRLSR